MHQTTSTLLATFALLLLVVPPAGRAQGSIYVMGGAPLTGRTTTSAPKPLGIPVVVLGVDTRLVSTIFGRFSLLYGFGHANFRDPCAACIPEGRVDLSQYESKPAIAAAGEFLLPYSVSEGLRIIAFAGGGLSLATEGRVDTKKDYSYRLDSHSAPFLTYGGTVAYRLATLLEIVGELRGATFFVGERRVVPGSYIEFDHDMGNVSGMVGLLGVRFRTRR